MGHERTAGWDTESAPLILIVDDDPDITTPLRALLSAEGLRCEVAHDGQLALDRALEVRPALVLLDLSLPSLSGSEVFARIRADHRTRYVPVIFLTSRGDRRERIRHLLAGGDDYVTKPFDVDELVARIQATLRRVRTLGGLNPISGLPGNSAIQEELAHRLRQGSPFACIYLDIDSFKPFNDRHGFSRGDALIRALAESLFASVEGVTPVPFLGHIGGDDFVIICEPAQAEPLANEVVARFKVASRSLHDPADVVRGGYEAIDRRGDRTVWPLTSVSAGVAVASDARFASAAAVAQAAAEMKLIAKAEGGGVAIDRRVRPER